LRRLLAIAAMALAAAPAAGALGAAKPYDFNGDGRQELVAYMPMFPTDKGAGAALAVRTGKHGLKRSASLISFATPGIRSFPTPSQGLGGGVASGDVNGDGYADLVMTGYPGIVVVYGTAHGLDPNHSQKLERAGHALPRPDRRRRRR
jgi:hypothetical protein